MAYFFYIIENCFEWQKVGRTGLLFAGDNMVVASFSGVILVLISLSLYIIAFAPGTISLIPFFFFFVYLSLSLSLSPARIGLGLPFKILTARLWVVGSNLPDILFEQITFINLFKVMTSKA